VCELSHTTSDPDRLIIGVSLISVVGDVDMALTGNRLLGLVGGLALLAFFAAGIAYLIYPPPPAPARGPWAVSLCLEGVLVLAVVNCISFFMGMLTTAKNWQEGEAISHAMFDLLSNGFSMIRGDTKARNRSRRRQGGRSR